MTMPNGRPVNVAGEGSQVGVQALNAYIDAVTIPGNVQLTVGQDASPEAKYQAGVENLKSGNPKMARKLIWDVMMSDRVNSEVLFHWLVAMLSGRTVVQFSEDELGQLKRSRSWYAEIGDDGWADGVRLIYRLLDSVLRPPAIEAERRAIETECHSWSSSSTTSEISSVTWSGRISSSSLGARARTRCGSANLRSRSPGSIPVAGWDAPGCSSSRSRPRCSSPWPG
jgi:hypothetical protein